MLRLTDDSYRWNRGVKVAETLAAIVIAGALYATFLYRLVEHLSR